jgi:hypothetical protein
VRIEFCEADILDLFDAWRRAVGVTRANGSAGAGEAGETAGRRARESLPAHIDRAIAKLAALGARGGSGQFVRALDDTVRELDRLRSAARQARGAARAAILDRLAELDVGLIDAARSALDASEAAELRARAESELAPFAPRMPADARAAALEAAFARLIRDAAGLPVLTVA